MVTRKVNMKSCISVIFTLYISLLFQRNGFNKGNFFHKGDILSQLNHISHFYSGKQQQIYRLIGESVKGLKLTCVVGDFNSDRIGH